MISTRNIRCLLHCGSRRVSLQRFFVRAVSSGFLEGQSIEEYCGSAV